MCDSTAAVARFDIPRTLAVVVLLVIGLAFVPGDAVAGETQDARKVKYIEYWKDDHSHSIQHVRGLEWVDVCSNDGERNALLQIGHPTRNTITLKVVKTEQTVAINLETMEIRPTEGDADVFFRVTRAFDSKLGPNAPAPQPERPRQQPEGPARPAIAQAPAGRMIVRVENGAAYPVQCFWLDTNGDWRQTTTNGTSVPIEPIQPGGYCDFASAFDLVWEVRRQRTAPHREAVVIPHRFIAKRHGQVERFVGGVRQGYTQSGDVTGDRPPIPGPTGEGRVWVRIENGSGTSVVIYLKDFNQDVYFRETFPDGRKVPAIADGAYFDLDTVRDRLGELRDAKSGAVVHKFAVTRHGQIVTAPRGGAESGAGKSCGEGSS